MTGYNDISHLRQQVAKARREISQLPAMDHAGERSKRERWIAKAKAHIAELENGRSCWTQP